MFYAFLALLVAAAIAEFATTGRLTLGGAALFYVALRLQAERAANQFAKCGKDGPPPPPWALAEDLEPWVTAETKREKVRAENPAEGPEIRVNPLGGKAKQKQYYGPRSENPAGERSEEKTAKIHVAAALPFPPRRAPRAAKREPAKAPKKTEPFNLPRFQGAPHEVLGVDRHADTSQILKAFRHWIKKHHPDHAGPNTATDAGTRAGDQARRLHEAKSALLKERAKQSGKNQAA